MGVPIRLSYSAANSIGSYGSSATRPFRRWLAELAIPMSGSGEMSR
jgi:hypothetical protein